MRIVQCRVSDESYIAEHDIVVYLANIVFNQTVDGEYCFVVIKNATIESIGTLTKSYAYGIPAKIDIIEGGFTIIILVLQLRAQMIVAETAVVDRDIPRGTNSEP